MADKAVGLTPEQQQLVHLQDGPYLVLAPPGSGKTEVLVQRALRLLREDDSDSSRLLALTFTRKAAREMSARIELELEDSYQRATVTTYHGFAAELLREHGSVVGFLPQTTVYSAFDDRVEALHQGLGIQAIQSDHLDQRSVASLLEQISRAKRDLILPEAATGEAVGLSASFSEVYAAYEEALRVNRAVDFDGLLLKAYQLLAGYPGVSRYFRKLYRWLMVDEGQDTCLAEYELLRAFCGADYRNVFIVADKDQSIFQFRGASSVYLDRFVTDFGASTIELGANFRCGQRLIEVSNSLLGRAPAKRQAPSSALGWVGAYSFRNEEAEARWVVSWISLLLDEGLNSEWLAAGEQSAVQPEDFAVLARSRRTLDSICEALEDANIDYVFSTGEASIFDSAIFRLVLYSVRVRSNVADLALRRSLINQLGVEEFSAAELESPLSSFFGILADATDEPLAEALRALASSEGDDPRDFGRWLMDWQPDLSEAEEESEDLRLLLEHDAEILRGRIRVFLNTARAEDRTWQGMVRAVTEQPAPDRSGVRVMTIHGAKGLEFRAVAVVGMNEGSLPDFRSQGDASDLEAERRLAYVAASRASRALVFTRSRSVKTRFGSRAKEESSFLRDAQIASMEI